jgi:hypothetical protein
VEEAAFAVAPKPSAVELTPLAVEVLPTAVEELPLAFALSRPPSLRPAPSRRGRWPPIRSPVPSS